MQHWPSLHPKPTRRQVIREEVLSYAKGLGLPIMGLTSAFVGGYLILDVARTPLLPPAMPPVTTSVALTLPTEAASSPLPVATRWSDSPPTQVPQMQVVVMVTNTPTPKPMPATLPTKSPANAVPMCGMGSTDGAPCKWSLPPVPTPTPYPMCVTPEPGYICIENPGRRATFGTPVAVTTPIWEGRGN